jgi:hypothetical protein
MRKHFFLLIAAAISCGKPEPDLSPIDLSGWKADKGGCENKRSLYIESLVGQKEELKGLSEKAVIALLGRPDRNELYKRNQKFYYYLLEAGPACAEPKAHPQQLVIRFNAMGLAKDVSVEPAE